MRAIFISYRREDAEGQAGRLFDDLALHFGQDSVFMDVVGIELGRDFRRVIDEKVTSCGVLLAVIGKSWLDAKDDSGRLRLENSMDFVRLEIASALKRDIPVIPVLVRGAMMPRADQLPQDLAELAYRNGVELTHARWDSDVEALVKALRPQVGLAGTVRPPDKPESALSAKKSLRRLVAMSGVAIAVAIGGGYVWHEMVADRTVEQPAAGPSNEAANKLPAVQNRKTEDKNTSDGRPGKASEPAKETTSDAKSTVPQQPSQPPTEPAPTAAAPERDAKAEVQSLVSRWLAASLTGNADDFVALAGVPFFYDRELVLTKPDLRTKYLETVEKRREVGRKVEIQEIKVQTARELQATGYDLARDRIFRRMDSMNLTLEDYAVSVRVGMGQWLLVVVRKGGNGYEVAGTWD